MRTKTMWVFVCVAALFIAGSCKNNGGANGDGNANVALVQRVYDEMWNQKKPEVIDQIFAPSHTVKMGGTEAVSHDAAAAKARLAKAFEVVPDVQYTVTGIAAEGNRVFVSWRAEGTAKASGTKVVDEGASVYTISDGKITATEIYHDSGRLQQQLGSAGGDGNSDVVRRFYDEVWNAKNINAHDQIVSSSAVYMNVNGEQLTAGSPAAKERLSRAWQMVPDVKYTINDLATSGDLVFASWTATGTHTGTVGNMKATGKQITAKGITRFRVADGKIVEFLVADNSAGVRRDMGVRQ